MIVASVILGLCFITLIGVVLWGLLDIVLDKFIEE